MIYLQWNYRNLFSKRNEALFNMKDILPGTKFRHKEQHYDEKALFYIRHFGNKSILHRNALAA